MGRALAQIGSVNGLKEGSGSLADRKRRGEASSVQNEGGRRKEEPDKDCGPLDSTELVEVSRAADRQDEAAGSSKN
jgi:hypothetical protein